MNLIYNERARQRVLRPMRGVRYRGFHVALFRTLDRRYAYPIRYMTTLHPLIPVPHRRTTLQMPSTARSRATAIKGAMQRIDSLNAPFCYGRHKR